MRNEPTMPPDPTRSARVEVRRGGGATAKNRPDPERKKAPAGFPVRAVLYKKFGGVLLSHRVPPAVPSAL